MWFASEDTSLKTYDVLAGHDRPALLLLQLNACQFYVQGSQPYLQNSMSAHKMRYLAFIKINFTFDKNHFSLLFSLF